MNKKGYHCIGTKCFDDENKIYDKETGEIYDKSYQEQCINFDIYPTIIPHKRRVIAIGDIHGDMNLAIKFLKIGKLIEEVDIEKIINRKSVIKEYIQTLEISKNSTKLNKQESTRTSYAEISDQTKNQAELVYRYYKINGEYYVRIVQEDNNVSPNNNRWFKWTGGETYVVQLGDQIDRCREFEWSKCTNKNTTIDDEDSDLEIMLFYDSLDRIAKRKNGRVFSLFGNHEIMNIKSDYRYVSYKGLVNFSPNKYDINIGSSNRTKQFKIIKKKIACTRSMILVIGDYLFVHGGISKEFAYKHKLVDTNALIRSFLFDKLKDNEEVRRMIESSKYSPLWYRKLALITESECENIFTSVIKNLNNTNFKSDITTDPVIKINGMIIAHTPQFSIFQTGITSICNNKLHRIDIGGSKAFSNFSSKEDPLSEKAREPQILEILTNIMTKESVINILK